MDLFNDFNARIGYVILFLAILNLLRHLFVLVFVLLLDKSDRKLSYSTSQILWAGLSFAYIATCIACGVKLI